MVDHQRSVVRWGQGVAPDPVAASSAREAARLLAGAPVRAEPRLPEPMLVRAVARLLAAAPVLAGAPAVAEPAPREPEACRMPAERPAPLAQPASTPRPATRQASMQRLATRPTAQPWTTALQEAVATTAGATAGRVISQRWLSGACLAPPSDRFRRADGWSPCLRKPQRVADTDPELLDAGSAVRLCLRTRDAQPTTRRHRRTPLTQARCGASARSVEEKGREKRRE